MDDRTEEAFMNLRKRFATALVFTASLTMGAATQETPTAPKCKAVHADLVEDRATVDCRPGHTSCYLGLVDGNHGLRGTTYFKADSFEKGPSTSPGWISYSGLFEYMTDRGTLVMRETGAFNVTQANPESGVTTAFQKIIDATGEFSGSTGHLFVYGFNINGHVVTRIAGEICAP
jgi:hypothetical protein